MRITVALATSIVALLAMANPGAAQAPEVSTALTSAELIACFEERGLRENVNYVIPKRGAFTPHSVAK
jgi:acyl-CoA reductase-like NAD-dependent aldehyde dehydrogenase